MTNLNIRSLLLCTGLWLGLSGCSHNSHTSDDGVTTPNKDAPNQTGGQTPGPGPSQDPGVTVKGRSLQIAKRSNSGDLSFGVIYSLASDQDGMSWQITYKTDITDAELKTLPDTMYWNVIYKLGETPRISAQDAADFALDKTQIRLGQMKITKPKNILAEIILTQQDGFIAFGTSPATTLSDPKFLIDLGDLCKASPEYFANITNTKKCSEIKVEDVGL